MYTIKSDKIYRDKEVVATINGDKVDFLPDMARYRAPAMRLFNQTNKESKDAKPAVSADSSAPADVVKPDSKAKDAGLGGVQLGAKKKEAKKEKVASKTGRPAWLDVVSDIVGEELPMPHRSNGWRKLKVRHKLINRYELIVKSDKLTSAEIKTILDMFL